MISVLVAQIYSILHYKINLSDKLVKKGVKLLIKAYKIKLLLLYFRKYNFYSNKKSV